jgi:hypothetical protein
VAFAPLIVAGVGAGISAIKTWKAGTQAKKAGEAQQRAAESSAGLTDLNAHIADLQAQDALDRGAVDESRLRTGIRRMVGTQRTGFAASNVVVDHGSAQDVQADTAYLGELDVMQARTNASREAWGYQMQAVDLRRRAEITRQEGANAAEAGRQAQKSARWGAVAGAAMTGASLVAQSPLAQRMGIGVAPKTSGAGFAAVSVGDAPRGGSYG